MQRCNVTRILLFLLDSMEDSLVTISADEYGSMAERYREEEHKRGRKLS